MRIAVCDDDSEQVQLITKLIHRWGKSNQAEVTVVPFYSAEEFQFKWATDHPFDMIILETKIRNKSGIELARYIRETDHETQILFITCEMGYALEGYDVSALHYLDKPVNPEKLRKVLDKAYGIAVRRDTGALLVHQDDRWVRIPYREILYMEQSAHYFAIYTKTKGNFRIKKNMKSMLSELDENFFIQCYRGTIVNIANVVSLLRNEVELSTGKRLRMSQPNAQRVTELFMEYHG